MTFFLLLYSGGRGKIKRKLTTLPRSFVHVVCQFVNLTQLHPQSSVSWGVSFSSRDSDKSIATKLKFERVLIMCASMQYTAVQAMCVCLTLVVGSKIFVNQFINSSPG